MIRERDPLLPLDLRDGLADQLEVDNGHLLQVVPAPVLLPRWHVVGILHEVADEVRRVLGQGIGPE